jgi:rare lipoprotein A
METIDRPAPNLKRAQAIAVTFAMFAIAVGAFQWLRAPQPIASTPPPPVACPKTPSGKALDCSGQSRTGIASFYAKRFGGRTMADGTPMRLNGDNAASRTLPLGTKALVTNLDTGKSSQVTIRDRGPYVGGRLVDLSPGTAHKIGLEPKHGLAHVVVTPITVPLADGTVKHGVASNMLSRHSDES